MEPPFRNQPATRGSKDPPKEGPEKASQPGSAGRGNPLWSASQPSTRDPLTPLYCLAFQPATLPLNSTRSWNQGLLRCFLLGGAKILLSTYSLGAQLELDRSLLANWPAKPPSQLASQRAS